MDKKQWKRDRKKVEQKNIEHLTYGIDFSGEGKGVTILPGSGIKDISPNPEKGVEIHDPRNG